MKVGHVAFSDAEGGAARAAFRVHSALKSLGIGSEMHVIKKGTDDPDVFPLINKYSRLAHAIRMRLVTKALTCIYSDRPSEFRSVALRGSGLIRAAERSGCDLINLHWIGNESVGLDELAKCQIPIVWRVADMWPFCGAEHYSDDSEFARWRSGYKDASRSPFFLDIDRVTWRRKKRLVPSNIRFIATSNYVAECLRSSALFQKNYVSVIPNPIDTEIYKPIDKSVAKKILGIPVDKRVILFGAIGGKSDPRKGWGFLEKALDSISRDPDLKDVCCAIFGQRKPAEDSLSGVPIFWLGRFFDDISLSVVYNSADLMVVPSQQETFGQTAVEAQACGVPVVAFNRGGPADIVKHKISGYLAVPFDSEDLEQGIKWVLNSLRQSLLLQTNARRLAVERFAYSVVADQYFSEYLSAIKEK